MSFRIDLAIEKEITAIVNKEARSVTNKVLVGVTGITPVLDGFARGSWQVSEGKPITTDTKGTDKVGNRTARKGAAVLKSHRNVKYPTFFVSSNKPYIGKLNDGSSKKAPAKFVETSIKRAVL